MGACGITSLVVWDDPELFLAADEFGEVVLLPINELLCFI
jgi:hypothetical protein